MKIKTRTLTYDQVMALPRPEHKLPIKPNLFFRSLIRLAALPDLWATRFTFDTSRMEAAGDGPYLILMNHSCFLDLEIVSRIFYPKPYCIVCTSDGFVGKEWLMRHIGCIPTRKFVSDVQLIRDMTCALKERGASVLMYPEASYSFDGTATPLPESVGKCLKFLQVPVLTVMTQGAFTRDPLYNGLQIRKTKVSAHVKYLFTPEELREKKTPELNAALAEAFRYDHFRWQYENRIAVEEPFRADGLNRILYKCPHCGTEGRMVGKGIHITCEACGMVYELTPYGKLEAADGDGAFEFVPDWYAWEREQVKAELEAGTYRLDVPVRICILADYQAIYEVGEGRLVHDRDGFRLTGCDGRLEYTQKPGANYGLYSDYFWYEIGDMICIGTKERQYYCFPTNGADVVAKTRMAAEELYKMTAAKSGRGRKKEG